jgi:hypothetical protein
MGHYASYNSANSAGGMTPLTSGQSITPLTIDAGQESKIFGIVKSDQAGTVVIEQSFDGTNWDYANTIAVTAGTGVKIEEDIIAPYARVRYTNGATNQGFLRIFLRAFGARTSS